MPAIGSTWKANSWVPQWKSNSWADAAAPPATLSAEVVALEKGWYGLRYRYPGDVFIMEYTGSLPTWVARIAIPYTIQTTEDYVLSGYHGVLVTKGFKKVRLP